MTGRRHPSPHELPQGPPRRSHAAAPVAAVILIAGLLLGTYTILVPVLLGFFLLTTGGSFLSARVNPLSLGYYLNTKPSWTAVGVVFLSAFMLFLAAYLYFVHGLAPILPFLHKPGG